MSAKTVKKPLTGKRAPRKKKTEGEEPKKRGNQGNFSGARLEYLTQCKPDYLAASAKGRGNIAPYITKFMAQWWERFPWYEGLAADGTPLAATIAAAPIDLSQLLPLPVKSDSEEEGTGMADASDAADKTLVNNDDDELQWKSTGGVNPALKDTIQTDIREKIKHWFSYRKTVSNRSNKNPYDDWLLNFRRAKSAPKKLALHKFYMQQEGYADDVESLFQERWPSAGLEPKQVLSFRCKLAQELLDAEEQEVIDELVEQQKAEHEEALREYEGNAARISAPETLNDDDRCACRTNLAQVVQPFIDGIAKMTGFHVTLLAGAPPPPDGSTKFALTATHSMHSGRTHVDGPGEGLKFDEWDMKAFKKLVLGHFMKFLLETAPRGAVPAAAEKAGGDEGNDVDGVDSVEGAKDGEEERGRAKGRKRAKGKQRARTTSSSSSSSSSSVSRPSQSPDPTPSPTLVPVALPWTPKLKHGCTLPDVVKDYVDAQATPRRRELMGLLSVSNEYEYLREVNIWRNRATFEGLGLMAASAAVRGEGGEGREIVMDNVDTGGGGDNGGGEEGSGGNDTGGADKIDELEGRDVTTAMCAELWAEVEGMEEGPRDKFLAHVRWKMPDYELVRENNNANHRKLVKDVAAGVGDVAAGAGGAPSGERGSEEDGAANGGKESAEEKARKERAKEKAREEERKNF
ncbi:hypothetical protein C8R46DRAFT_1031020 [Mycena filopes]|nr:hypothetical protein C8R46DRAFT_1031020 [Mycena filopes]